MNAVHLIVAEKNISARRIAEILSEGKKITEHKDTGVSTYTFGDTTTVDRYRQSKLFAQESVHKASPADLAPVLEPAEGHL